MPRTKQTSTQDVPVVKTPRKPAAGRWGKTQDAPADKAHDGGTNFAAPVSLLLLVLAAVAFGLAPVVAVAVLGGLWLLWTGLDLLCVFYDKSGGGVLPIWRRALPQLSFHYFLLSIMLNIFLMHQEVKRSTKWEDEKLQNPFLGCWFVVCLIFLMIGPLRRSNYCRIGGISLLLLMLASSNSGLVQAYRESNLINVFEGAANLYAKLRYGETLKFTNCLLFSTYGTTRDRMLVVMGVHIK